MPIVENDLAVAPKRLVHSYDSINLVGSSGLFVANGNSTAAEADVDDPTQFYLDANNTKVIPIVFDGASELHLYHFYTGADTATNLTVRAYGIVPVEYDKGLKEPKNFNASFPELSHALIGGAPFFPLYKPGATHPAGANDHVLVLQTAGAPEVHSDAATPYKLHSQNTIYNVKGARIGLVLVSVAANNVTAGCVLGRLVWGT